MQPPHTIHSVYECSLASGCGLDCRNRLVQRGPTFRLEVIRCMQTDGKFAKGWGVRSPDFVPKGSFICEYIGEYISDDEAERCAHVMILNAQRARDLAWSMQLCRSRGIRYDNQKMSRLMDVVGDGKDVVRMCIDATHFSNLGRCANATGDPMPVVDEVWSRHLNHSCIRQHIHEWHCAVGRANGLYSLQLLCASSFLNHSCDPNCFKQRIFCDHNSRLPRIGAPQSVQHKRVSLASYSPSLTDSQQCGYQYLYSVLCIA